MPRVYEPRHLQLLRQGIVDAGGEMQLLHYERPLAGGRVAAWHLKPKQSGRGLVVFVHGTGNDSLFPQAHLFRDLIQAGYDIFTFDLDGHGVNSTTNFALPVVESAVAAAIETARQRQPRGPLHVIGFSLGGALALKLLATSDLSIHSLTVIAAPHTLNLSYQAMLMELTAAVRPALYLQVLFYGPWGLLPAAGNFKRRHFPLRMTTRQSGLDYTPTIADLFSQLHLTEIAPKIKVPTLLLYGSRDYIAPASQGEDLQRLIPHSRLKILRGETHFTTLLNPETTRMIIAFFAEHDDKDGKHE